MNKFENVKIGDRVVDVLYGEGVVVEHNLEKDCDYPAFFVQFQSIYKDSVMYRLDGSRTTFYSTEERVPALFWLDGYLPPTDSTEPLRKPIFKFDEVIEVRVGEGDPWLRRHFKKWENDEAVCFIAGRSSKTADENCEVLYTCYRKYIPKTKE